ncbi:MAG: hypothetical protein AVDCRST_MAG67-4390, partial [uncultured Solirubrobacteraceae bacterium]
DTRDRARRSRAGRDVDARRSAGGGRGRPRGVLGHRRVGLRLHRARQAPRGPGERRDEPDLVDARRRAHPHDGRLRGVLEPRPGDDVLDRRV